MDPAAGYGWIPHEMLGEMPAAVEFAKKALEKWRSEEHANERRAGKRGEEYLVHMFQAFRYEEAPPLFNLALSDEILQIAMEYLGEVPVLSRVQVLWSPVNRRMKGSQLYHRDDRQWFSRRAKFIFAATDVDDSSGPFTFLPADISERVSRDFGGFKMQNRVTDEEMYRYVSHDDELKFVGPAGSGLVIDSNRCFHFGSRSRGSERLVIMFSFFGTLDLPPGRGKGDVWRSPAFLEKFDDDPVRMAVVPDDESADHLITHDEH
jgi:hypothetical protein